VQGLTVEVLLQTCPHTAGLLLVGMHQILPVAEEWQRLALGEQCLRLLV